MAYQIINGSATPSAARIISFHGKKAQVRAAARTQHMLESAVGYHGNDILVLFRNRDGEEFGFTFDELHAAISNR